MKKLNIKRLKKKIIKLSVIIIFLFTIGVLVYQYTLLFDLKQKNTQLKITNDNLTNEIDSTQKDISDYQAIINDETLLNKYATQNGYYNTDKVYKIN